MSVFLHQINSIFFFDIWHVAYADLEFNRAVRERNSHFFCSNTDWAIERIPSEILYLNHKKIGHQVDFTLSIGFTVNKVVRVISGYWFKLVHYLGVVGQRQ